MNLLELLTKLFLGPGIGAVLPRPSEMSRQALDQVRLTLRSLILLGVLGTILCILVGYLVDRVLTVLDAGFFSVSNSILFLLIATTANCLSLIWVWRRSKNATANVLVPAEKPLGSPLETALAALILNYVKERELAQASKQRFEE